MFIVNGKKFNLPLLRKDPFKYIKENFLLIDETENILPPDQVSALYDDSVDEEMDRGNGNERLNKKDEEGSHTVFEDEELLKVIRAENKKRNYLIKHNTKIQKNISLSWDSSSNSNEFSFLETKDKKNSSLDNVKRSKILKHIF